MVSGCRFFNKKDAKKADTTAAWQAKQDSLKKVQEAIAAREKAVQDSLQRVQEMLAKLRFHVIIGSFKVPTNADNWQQQVATMGFKDSKIVEANGFRMVSVGAYDSYSKAFTEMNKINEGRQDSIELWVYEAR